MDQTYWRLLEVGNITRKKLSVRARTKDVYNSREHALPRGRKMCSGWEAVRLNSQWKELWFRHTGNDSTQQEIKISLERDKVDLGLCLHPVCGGRWVDQIVGDSTPPWGVGGAETWWTDEKDVNRFICPKPKLGPWWSLCTCQHSQPARFLLLIVFFFSYLPVCYLFECNYRTMKLHANKQACVMSQSMLMSEEARELYGISFTRSSGYSWGLQLSWPPHIPKAPPPNTVTGD